MPGPPPPPPGPPPPPMMAMSPMKKPAASGSGDNRNALLSQIQKGKQLKKVTTVDKSKPIGAGSVAGESSPAASSPMKTSRGPPSNKSSPDSSTSSPVSSASSRGAPPGGFASLTDELQHKLTLKKNKQSPMKESVTKESSPPSNAPSNLFVNEIKAKQQPPQSVISPFHQPKVSSLSSTTSSTKSINNTHNNNPNLSDAVANKSSLFSTQKSQTSASVAAAPAVPKFSHGKPNLAPKPPPQLSLAINNNSILNNEVSNDVSRKAVARHQSMKSPRSPPIAPSPMDNHSSTMHRARNNIQDTLNLQMSAQKTPQAQRPTNRPPPPPVPNRNLGTNLSNQPHAKSTTALNNAQSDLSAPRRITNSGSSNNINSSDAIDAPPLPPHRITSRPLQLQQAVPPASNQITTAMPPEVPRRHSSMRNSVENGGNVLSSSSQNNRYPSPNPNQPITRLVVDLEARYSLLFHSISEFPPPKQFTNVVKSYPSKQAVRPTNGI